MRIVFSVALSAAIFLSGTQAVRLRDLDDEAATLAQTELEQDGQSMPTINIIDNNRNMTGVAPSCGCGGGMPGGGGPFQAAMSPNGGVMNSLGAPGAGMPMGGAQTGNMMGQMGMGGPMGMGNAGAGATGGAMSFPNFMMAQTDEQEAEQMAQTQAKACACEEQDEE